MIACVVLRGGAAQSDPDTIQACQGESPHNLGKTPIGVDIDGALGRSFSEGRDGSLQEAILQERLTLTALAETDDGCLGIVHMGQSHFNDLLHRGDEGNSQMGPLTALIRLEGQTTETPGIAAGRGRDGKLPTSIEDVFRRETVVAEGTVGQVLKKTILGKSPQKIPDPERQLFVVFEESWMPVRVGIQADPRCPETVLPPSDSPIGPERENRILLFQMRCREETSQIAGSQKSGYGCTLEPTALNLCFLDRHEGFRLWVPSNRVAAWKCKELAPPGQWG